MTKDGGKTIADLYVSHLFGLTTSASTTYTNGFVIAPGHASAISDNTPMKLASGMDKNAGATWAAGKAQGGMESGTTLVANSSYFTYEIAKPGGTDVDIVFSASPTAPTMPSGYTLKRRIHAWVTDAAGAIRKMRQVGGWSHFLVPFEITVGTVAFAGPGAAAVNVGMNFPVGIKLEADLAIGVVAPASSPGRFCGVCDPDKGAATIYDTVVYNLGGSLSTTIWQQMRSWTNTNSQLSVFLNSPGSFRAFVRGYYDIRDTYF